MYQSIQNTSKLKRKNNVEKANDGFEPVNNGTQPVAVTPWLRPPIIQQHRNYPNFSNYEE
jgi:hypothetical protein